MFDKQTREISYLSQFMLSNCFYCKLRNLSFLDYGLFCKNLYGKSYLSDIVVDISEYHYTGIILHYGERSQFDYNRYTEVALIESLCTGKVSHLNLIHLQEHI